MSSRVGRVAGVALVVALLPVLGGAGASLYAFRTDAVAPAAAAALPAAAPVSTTYVGAVTNNPKSFGKAIGIKPYPNLAVQYINWDGIPPVKFIENQAKAHRASFLELEPRDISLKHIIAGKGDSYLKTLGKDLATTNSRVMLSFAPEADGHWYRWGYHRRSARTFRRAWRHVYRVVTSVPGTKITWVWQMSHKFSASEALKPLWPGRNYVTMVGIDGYFETTQNTFHSIFGRTITIVRRFTQEPIFISETAVGQMAGRVVKTRDLFAGMRRNRISGFIWFDHNQHRGVHHQRWKLQGHRREIRAFRKGMQRWLQAMK
jgi:mannan endo-1,4-beta-mannosidase